MLYSVQKIRYVGVLRLTQLESLVGFGFYLYLSNKFLALNGPRREDVKKEMLNK